MNVNYQHPQPPNQPPYQPYQGYPPPSAPPAPKKRRNWLWALGMVLAAFVILVAVVAITNPNQPGSSPSDTPAAGAPANAAEPQAPAKPAGPAREMTGGVYQVGVDVQAGRYKTPGPPADDLVGLCYWARLKDDTGDFESIISNGNVQGPGSVTVKKGEFVELTGACTWTKVRR